MKTSAPIYFELCLVRLFDWFSQLSSKRFKQPTESMGKFMVLFISEFLESSLWHFDPGAKRWSPILTLQVAFMDLQETGYNTQYICIVHILLPRSVLYILFWGTICCLLTFCSKTYYIVDEFVGQKIRAPYITSFCWKLFCLKFFIFD